MAMPTKRRRTRSGPPSLLIMQLNVDKLRQDELLFSDLARFVGLVTLLASGATIESIETTDLRNLKDQLGRLEQAGHRFDVVVAIGHSNHTGIKVASDKFAEWDEFAGYIKRFEPRRLVLVACQAGRWPAANTLFKKLPKLRRIFASPVNASKDLGQLMLAIVPYLVEVKAPRSDVVFKAQAFLAAATGRQVRQWLRVHDMNKPEGVLLDFASQAAHPIIQELHGALRKLWK